MVLCHQENVASGRVDFRYSEVTTMTTAKSDPRLSRPLSAWLGNIFFRAGRFVTYI